MLSKRHSTDADHAAVWDKATSIVPRADADAAVERAAAELIEVVGDSTCAIAWSGGKDSLGLEVVYRAAGLPMRGMLSVALDIEWPAMRAWFAANTPDGIEVMDRSDAFNLDWLATQERVPLPDPSIFREKVTRWGQHEYQRRHPEVEVVVMGRRRSDGNWFNAKDPHGKHESKGVVHYSPIRDWSHEMLFAVLRHNRVEMPPIYDWPGGWTNGTGPWPGWHCGWDLINLIDPTLAPACAAAGVADAERFLETR